MPIGIETLLLLAAFVCAVFTLANRLTAGAALLLLCVLEAVRMYGR